MPSAKSGGPEERPLGAATHTSQCSASLCHSSLVLSECLRFVFPVACSSSISFMISSPSVSSSTSEPHCSRSSSAPLRDVESHKVSVSLSDSTHVSEGSAPPFDSRCTLEDELEVELLLCCEPVINKGLERREHARGDRQDEGWLPFSGSGDSAAGPDCFVGTGGLRRPVEERIGGNGEKRKEG